MSETAFAALWCMGQVTLVAIVGLVVAVCVTKRSPEVAARTVGWAAIIAIAITLLIPVSIPHWSWPSSAVDQQEVTRLSHQADVSDAADRNSEMSSSSSGPTGGFVIDAATFLRNVRRGGTAQPTRGLPVARYVAIGLIVCVAIGLAKLLLGFVLLRSMRSRSEIVEDSTLTALADEVAHRMGRPRRVTLATSSAVGCAAVVGFLRPMILLSPQWKSWSANELRAVLAHELAHVARGDSLWRMIGAICSAIHFYNPLVRWLAGRLVLAQELAADRRAVEIGEGAGSYLLSLSRLAIRQDMGPRVQSQPLLTPVFAGHLTRRIEMLRAKDCEQNHVEGRYFSFAVIALIFGLGFSTSAMRGLAEPPESQESENATGAIQPVVMTSSEPWKSTLFRREKASATNHAFGETGALHLNVNAIAKIETFFPILDAYNNEVMPSVLAEKCDITMVESISSDVHWMVRAGVDGEKNTVAFGAHGIVLKTTEDVDWRVALAKRFPDLAERTKEGLEYLEAMMPALGPVPVRFRPVNPRELSVSLGGPPNGVDVWHVNETGRKQPVLPWSDEWNAVSGGFATLVMAKPDTDLPPVKEDIGSKQIDAIYKGTDLLAFGFDVSNDGSLLEVKCRLRCEETADPDGVLGEVEELIAVFREAFDSKISSDAESDDIDRMMLATLRSAKSRRLPGETNIIECHLRFDLPADLLTLLGGEFDIDSEKPQIDKTTELPDQSATRR